MNIFKQIKNSIYGPDYYKSVVLNQPFSSSVKYLAKVSLLASLVTAIIFSFSMPIFYVGLKTLVKAEVANYPDDLVVTIKGGMASVNKPEPYSIPMIMDSNDASDYNNPLEKNLVVIDTTKPFNLDNFRSYSTMTLLTKTDLIVPKDSKGSFQIIPLSKLSDIEVTKSLLQQLEIKFTKILPAFIGMIIVCMYIISLIVYFIGTLMMLLLYAIFIWLLGKLREVDLTYKKSYQIGLHASTIIIILSLLGLFAHVLNTFFIKSIAVLIVAYINIFPDTPKEVVATPIASI